MRTSLLLIPTLALLNWGIASTAARIPNIPSRSTISDFLYNPASNKNINATSENTRHVFGRRYRTPTPLYGRQLHNADYGAGSGNSVPSSSETDSSLETGPTPSAPPAASATPQVRSLAIADTRPSRRSLDAPKYKMIPYVERDEDTNEEPDCKGENRERPSGEDSAVKSWGWSRDIVPATLHGGADGDTAETNEEVQDAAGGLPNPATPRAFPMNGCGDGTSSEYTAQRRGVVPSDLECQPEDFSGTD